MGKLNINFPPELVRRSRGHTLYLMDEPTTGLHPADVSQLMKVINELIKKDNTVVIIEHNLDVIRCADWVIDIGPEGGKGGGNLLAFGPQIRIAQTEASHTGKFLKPFYFVEIMESNSTHHIRPIGEVYLPANSRPLVIESNSIKFFDDSDIRQPNRIFTHLKREDWHWSRGHRMKFSD